MPAGSDVAVRGTNDDAQISKMSCVRLGYFSDNFLKHFVRRGSTRRAPLINRGYYARTAALKQLIHQFLSSGQCPKQVLSLGAGFDTTWFHLKAAGCEPAKYFEVDFEEVTKKKAAIIGNTEELFKLVGPLTNPRSNPAEGRVLTQQYALLPVDLREVADLEAALKEAGFRPDLMTLVIAECVLVYMPPEDSQRLVSRLGELLPTAAFVVYEQIKPYDAFGEQMMLNLERRGCPLIGIYGSPDLQAQQARFTEHHWQQAWSVDMDTVYARHIDPKDKQRIERLEIFDELEEWHLIQEHYCLSIGINDQAGALRHIELPTYTQPSLQFLTKA